MYKIKRFNNTYQAFSLDNVLKSNEEAIFTHHLELVRWVWEKISTVLLLKNLMNIIQYVFHINSY